MTEIIEHTDRLLGGSNATALPPEPEISDETSLAAAVERHDIEAANFYAHQINCDTACAAWREFFARCERRNRPAAGTP